MRCTTSVTLSIQRRRDSTRPSNPPGTVFVYFAFNYHAKYSTRDTVQFVLSTYQVLVWYVVGNMFLVVEEGTRIFICWLIWKNNAVKTTNILSVSQRVLFQGPFFIKKKTFSG
jgi:hypothetical protein